MERGRGDILSTDFGRLAFNMVINGLHTGAQVPSI